MQRPDGKGATRPHVLADGHVTAPENSLAQPAP